MKYLRSRNKLAKSMANYLLPSPEIRFITVKCRLYISGDQKWKCIAGNLWMILSYNIHFTGCVYEYHNFNIYLHNNLKVHELNMQLRRDYSIWTPHRSLIDKQIIKDQRLHHLQFRWLYSHFTQTQMHSLNAMYFEHLKLNAYINVTVRYLHYPRPRLVQMYVYVCINFDIWLIRPQQLSHNSLD